MASSILNRFSWCYSCFIAKHCFKNDCHRDKYIYVHMKNANKQISYFILFIGSHYLIYVSLYTGRKNYCQNWQLTLSGSVVGCVYFSVPRDSLMWPFTWKPNSFADYDNKWSQGLGRQKRHRNTARSRPRRG